MRGRYISKMVLPLSFGEIASASVRLSDTITFRERGALVRLLSDYMSWGMPEVWSYRSREKVVSILETMFYRDVIERYRIRNSAVFLELANLVISNYSNPVTWSSLRRTLASEGIELDTKTIMSYVHYMSRSFLIFLVRRFSYSERGSSLSPRKVYVVDPSIASLFERPMDLGRRMENLTFLELLRRGYHPNCYLTSSGREVDFLVRREGAIELIEVAVEPDGNHLAKLLEAMSELKVRRASIVTWDPGGLASEGRKGGEALASLEVAPLGD